MAGPLTPNRQYNHVTETFIAFSTFSTLSYLPYLFFREDNSAALIATVVPLPDSKIRMRSELIAFFAGLSASKWKAWAMTPLLCWDVYCVLGCMGIGMGGNRSQGGLDPV